MTNDVHYQFVKLTVARVRSTLAFESKLIALPPLGELFLLKEQELNDAVFLICTSDSSIRISCRYPSAESNYYPVYVLWWWKKIPCYSAAYTVSHLVVPLP